jgi:hypothetical protein
MNFQIIDIDRLLCNMAIHVCMIIYSNIFHFYMVKHLKCYLLVLGNLCFIIVICSHLSVQNYPRTSALSNGNLAPINQTLSIPAFPILSPASSNHHSILNFYEINYFLHSTKMRSCDTCPSLPSYFT